jgi:outer membrane protein OmpA-like peptidoglycan-associated protein
MRTLACLVSLYAIGCAPAARPGLRLRKVVLYQNGIGYFERAGAIGGETLRLSFPKPELDDVLKTLTVIDRDGAGVATVAVRETAPSARTVELDVQMAANRLHDLFIAYAVPTPTWKAAYRVVLDESKPDHPSALLQAWAMVNNVSQEDWHDVQLTLATGAPMSFALDLHTPQFVPRPDATGKLVTPTVLAPIADERAGYRDTDGDAIADSIDKCPDQPEDLDGIDDDGCPDPDADRDRSRAPVADRDRDGVPDSEDACPTERELFNGHDDDDGCPDRGRVVVSSSEMRVLEAILFPQGVDELPPAALPIVDAIAATLAGAPDITRVEVGGHAGPDEADPWGLSSRRAAAVRAALIARGVDSSRLAIVPYGGTRSIGGKPERDRRVEFLITGRAGDTRPPTTLDARAVASSARAATAPHDVAGAVRYVVTEPVTIPRGVSTMVSILNRDVPGEDVLLYRPDPAAPGSDRYPFRAMRLVNRSGFTLEPGPVAVFARGSFVGDGLLRRLDVGETTWIPYAIDSATTITAVSEIDEQPIRIVSIARGVLTVEDAGVRTTRYRVAAGREPPSRLFVRHDRAAGFAAKSLPPDTVDQGDAYLVPLPLAGGKTSELVVEEREPRKKAIALMDVDTADLVLYVDGGGLPQAVQAKLRTAIALRKDMGAIEAEIETLRERIADVAARADELRDNLRALDRVAGAGDLRKKLVASLGQTTSQSDAIARSLGAKTEALAAARARLADAIREVTLDETVAAK